MSTLKETQTAVNKVLDDCWASGCDGKDLVIAAVSWASGVMAQQSDMTTRLEMISLIATGKYHGESIGNLRKLMGHYQNGSDTKVTISQDDATGDIVLRLGDLQTGKCFVGRSLEQVIEFAFVARQGEE